MKELPKPSPVESLRSAQKGFDESKNYENAVVLQKAKRSFETYRKGLFKAV